MTQGPGRAATDAQPGRTPAVLRRAVRLAGAYGLGAAMLCWLLKDIPPLYQHEPWQNDPYDAVVSFGMVAIALLSVLILQRALLVGRAEGQQRRGLDLLGASRLLTGLIAAVFASDWISVAVRADRSTWNGSTAIACAILAAGTAAGAGYGLLVRRAGALAAGWPEAADRPDWLDDASTLALMAADRLGVPANGAVRRAIVRIDEQVFGRIRAHPLWTALLAAIALGLAAETPQIVLEGYQPELALLVFTVSACSFYAFVVVVGARLRLVGRGHGGRRYGVGTAVAVAAAVALAASFRDALWSVLGVDTDTAGIGQLAVLMAGTALIVVLVGLPVERLLRLLGRLGWLSRTGRRGC